jgi:hypothetical protein
MKHLILLLLLIGSSAFGQSKSVRIATSNNTLFESIYAPSDAASITGMPLPNSVGSFAFDFQDYGGNSINNSIRRIYARSRYIQFTLTPPPGEWTDIIIKCLPSSPYPWGYNPSPSPVSYACYFTTMDRTGASMPMQTHKDIEYNVELWTSFNPLNDGRVRWIQAAYDTLPMSSHIGTGGAWQHLTGLRITITGGPQTGHLYDGAYVWVALWTSASSVYQVGGYDAWLPIQPTLVPNTSQNFGYYPGGAAHLGVNPPVYSSP